jgi:hypothetical protein
VSRLRARPRPPRTPRTPRTPCLSHTRTPVQYARWRARSYAEAVGHAGAGALLPIAAFLRTLRRGRSDAPLPRAVASIIDALFSALDTRGEGALPLNAAVGAFRGDAHPAVAAGRIPPTHVWRLFRDSFEECFALVDGRGGGGARYRGGPTAEAYYGAGDGAVRAPFFAEWCEGLAAGCADEGAFGLVANSLWGGGAGALARGRRTIAAAAAAGAGNEGSMLTQMSSERARGGERGGGSSAPAHAFAVGASTAAKCVEGEEDLAAIMGRFGGRGGPGARFSSAHYAAGGAPGAGAALPPSPTRAALSHVAAEGTSRSMRGLLPGPPTAHTAAGGAAGAGARGSGLATLDAPSPPRGRAGGGGALAPAAAELAAALRAPLRRAGAKATLRLIRAVERAAGMAAGAAGPLALSHADSVPPEALLPVLRDAGGALGGGEGGALAAAFPGAAAGSVDAGALVGALCGGALPAARREVVDAAWRRVADAAAAGRGVSPRGTFPPRLADFRDLYAASAHPDVRAGKRSEEDALTEFLETFGGPTFVNEAASGAVGGPAADAPVTEAGFRAYYAAVGAHVDSDAHFAAVLFDTWGLQWAGGQAHTGDARAAGGGLEPAARSSVSQLLGGAPPAYRLGPRGPGQEGLPREAYAAGGAVVDAYKGKGWGRLERSSFSLG